MTSKSQSLNKNILRLSEQLGQKLLSRNWTLCTAESCTGGGVAAVITKIAGSSEWFEYGIVSYANAAKIKLLNVQTTTLEKFGAVSEETVTEMLKGVLTLSGAHVGIAVSGIAGPSGGTEEKPIGTVWFAVGECEKFQTFHQRFSGDRDSIQQQAIEYSLLKLNQFLI